MVHHWFHVVYGCPFVPDDLSITSIEDNATEKLEYVDFSKLTFGHRTLISGRRRLGKKTSVAKNNLRIPKARVGVFLSIQLTSLNHYDAL